MSVNKDDFYLVKSEFSFAVYFLYIILIVFAGVTTFWFIPQLLNSAGIKGFVLYLLIFCFGLFDLFAVIHPLTSCYNVYYDGEYLLYKWTFLPRKRKIHAEKIEGYYTMKVPSRDNEYITAYPVSGDQTLPAISSFYFDNYTEIVKVLPGEEIERLKFSWGRYYRISILGKRPV